MAHTSPQDAVKRIWYVFTLLSIATGIEVIFGILRPALLVENFLLGMKYLNWIFILLTIFKAYYITWTFMHMEGETKGLRRAVVWTAAFLITYLVAILLVEGDYIYEVYRSGHVKYNF